MFQLLVIVEADLESNEFDGWVAEGVFCLEDNGLNLVFLRLIDQFQLLLFKLEPGRQIEGIQGTLNFLMVGVGTADVLREGDVGDGEDVGTDDLKFVWWGQGEKGDEKAQK